MCPSGKAAALHDDDDERQKQKCKVHTRVSKIPPRLLPAKVFCVTSAAVFIRKLFAVSGGATAYSSYLAHEDLGNTAAVQSLRPRVIINADSDECKCDIGSGSYIILIRCQVGFRAIGFYMSTTVLAVILGIILVTVIHPGQPGTTEDDIKKVRVKENNPII